MTIALITQPATEPLALLEVKAHLRIDHDHEDTLLLETLKAARHYTEFASGQKLITQAWRQYEICFPQDRSIHARVGPVQSIAAITAFDGDGTPHTVASQDAVVVRGASVGLIEFSSSFDPELALNGLEIDLVVGIADFGVDIPDTLKRAILMLVAHWYENRENSTMDKLESTPFGFDEMINIERGNWYG